MTPKEKALELVEKMYDNILEPHGQESKQCALIAVDECLNTCVESSIYYWNEVKQEI